MKNQPELILNYVQEEPYKKARMNIEISKRNKDFMSLVPLHAGTRIFRILLQKIFFNAVENSTPGSKWRDSRLNPEASSKHSQFS